MISKQSSQGQYGQKCAPVLGNAKLVLNLSVTIIILLLPTVNPSFLSEYTAENLNSEFLDSKKHHLEVSEVILITTNHVAFICCEEESSVNKTCILGNTDTFGECNWPKADGQIFNPYSGKINMTDSNSDMLLSYSQQCKKMYTGEESAPFKLKDLNVLPKGDVKNEIKTVGCTVTEQVSSRLAKKWSKVVGLDIHTIDNQNVFVMYIVRQKHDASKLKLIPPICMDVFIGSTLISCNVWFVSVFYIMPFIIYWIAYYYNVWDPVLVLIGWLSNFQIQHNGQNKLVIGAVFCIYLAGILELFYFGKGYPIVGTINGLQYEDI